MVGRVSLRALCGIILPARGANRLRGSISRAAARAFPSAVAQLPLADLGFVGQGAADGLGELRVFTARRPRDPLYFRSGEFDAPDLLLRGRALPGRRGHAADRTHGEAQVFDELFSEALLEL